MKTLLLAILVVLTMTSCKTTGEGTHVSGYVGRADVVGAEINVGSITFVAGFKLRTRN